MVLDCFCRYKSVTDIGIFHVLRTPWLVYLSFTMNRTLYSLFAANERVIDAFRTSKVMCILGQIYFGVKCLCFGQYTNDINLRYDIYINDFFRLTLNGI